MTTRRVLGQCVHLGAVLLLIGADAAAFPTAQSREFLVVGNGPVSDSSGEFTNAGVGSAVDVSQFELGANQRTVPSPTDPSLAGNVPLLPVGAAPVGVGVVGDGNVAVTHPGGVFTLSNVDLFADLGIRCAAGAAACTDGASNSFVNPPGPGIPAGGVAGNQSFSGLLAELTAARAQIPGLAATSVLDVGASGGKIASDTTLQLAPGLNVVDIVTGGADFLLENANLVVDGPPGAVAILRVDPSANFLVSNGNVVVGSGGIGLNHVVFVSLKSDNATHFSVSNAVLNGVAFWDLGAGGSSISVQNAQGCTQWIGDKVSLQDVRFSRCAFEGPVCPAGPDQDADGDGVGDACDSCPFVANSDQSDIGGIGADSGPDGIGDACQCGDVTGDGFVTLSDAVVIARSQLQPPAAVPAKAERCDVGGGTGPTGSTCTLADAVIVRRALLSPAAATIQPVCAGAE